jgi:probable phosphoglycerate mutase
MKGEWRVKDANLSVLCSEARGMLSCFEKVEFNYVPREQNKAADKLANQALDNAIK